MQQPSLHADSAKVPEKERARKDFQTLSPKPKEWLGVAYIFGVFEE